MFSSLVNEADFCSPIKIMSRVTSCTKGKLRPFVCLNRKLVKLGFPFYKTGSEKTAKRISDQADQISCENTVIFNVLKFIDPVVTTQYLITGLVTHES